MENNHKIKSEIVTILAFIILISVGFVLSIREVPLLASKAIENSKSGVSEAVSQFEESYNNIFSNQSFAIDYFGLIHRILGKREIKNFDVVKDNNGVLYFAMHYTDVDMDKVTVCRDSLKKLFEQTQLQKAKFLFVQVPFKDTGGIKELEYYSTSSLNLEYDKLLIELNNAGIPNLDLRKVDKAKIVYKTDHHWTVESSFYASSSIITAINELFGFDLDKDGSLRDRTYYKEVTYPNSLLGSMGIRTGKYYAGKDDFTILKPVFPTSLHYEHLIKSIVEKTKDGDFWDAFIDQSILDNNSYYNKYNANLNGGYVENRILNHYANNDLKVLLISDSYGRPLAQYLGLYFKETRYLDPKPGRYDENYLKYIREYKPDIVIGMYNDKINVGN